MHFNVLSYLITGLDPLKLEDYTHSDYDLNAATRGPFIQSLISCLFSDEVLIGIRK